MSKRTFYRPRTSDRVSAATAFALLLAGCTGSNAPAVDRATGALGEAPLPSDDVPPGTVDSARVDRADDALLLVLEGTDDPEARLAARFSQFETASAEVQRDADLDLSSVTATGAALRARLLDSPEARRDGEEADRARALRGDVFVPTAADRASFEMVLAGIDERAAERERAPAPRELRTPEGVSTTTVMPTAEELRHGAR